MGRQEGLQLGVTQGEPDTAAFDIEIRATRGRTRVNRNASPVRNTHALCMQISKTSKYKIGPDSTWTNSEPSCEALRTR